MRLSADKYALLPNPLDALHQRYAGAPRREAWRADPALWAWERLRIVLWSKQVELLNSVAVNQRTAVRACHAVGKSFSAALAALWWIDVHEPGRALVVSTAPTGDQVRKVLWKEIGSIHARGKLPGTVLQNCEWKLPIAGREEIVAFGRKPADSNVHGFQGQHAPDGVLAIIDEACGVVDQMWTAVSAITTSAHCRELAIGNPDVARGKFFAAFGAGSSWNQIHIDALESPNFTAEGATLPESTTKGLVDQTFVDRILADCYGDTGHPIYRAKIRGEFTLDDPGSVISASELAFCRNLTKADHPQLLCVEWPMPHCLGVDIGAGGDRTVIAEREGSALVSMESQRTPREAQIVAMVVNKVAEIQVRSPHGRVQVHIDANGVGWGAYQRLMELQECGDLRALVVPIYSGAPYGREAKVVNRRAKMWWDFRELVEKHRVALPALTERSAAELLIVRWERDATNRIKIEKKEDIIKRLGASCDEADAIVMAFAASGSEAPTDYQTEAIHMPHSEAASWAW